MTLETIINNRSKNNKFFDSYDGDDFWVFKKVDEEPEVTLKLRSYADDVNGVIIRDRYGNDIEGVMITAKTKDDAEVLYDCFNSVKDYMETEYPEFKDRDLVKI